MRSPLRDRLFVMPKRRNQGPGRSALTLVLLVASVLPSAANCGQQAPAPQEAPVVKKQAVDKTKPVRFEKLVVLESVPQEAEAKPKLLAEFLESGFFVPDNRTRGSSTYSFHRNLLRLASGRKFAQYVEIDSSDEKAGRIRTLLVDVDRARFILLVSERLVRGPGMWNLREAEEEAPRGEELWSVTTRTLRQGPVKAKLLRESTFPQVLLSEEKELLADLEEVRQVLGCGEFPSRWCWGILYDLEKLLNLPPAKPCKCQDREVAKALANDEPQAAQPLDPAFEAEFGKWASWRELPKLKE